MAIGRKPSSKPASDPAEAAAERFIEGAGATPETAKAPDESGMKPTMIRMELELRDRADAAAKAKGMGRSAYIRGAIIARLESEGR